MMKNLLLTGMLALGMTAAMAQNNTTTTAPATPTWSVDKSHSSIGFAVTHMGISKTTGNFTDYEAKMTSTKDDFSDAQFELTVQAKSINTGDANRDKHLQGADFFDVEKNPTITFKSTAFRKTKGNNYKLEGDLTMHGVTKKVSFDVVMGGPKKDPWGNTKVGFMITGVVNRTDYGINWNADLPEGGKLVDNMVELSAFMEVLKGK